MCLTLSLTVLSIYTRITGNHYCRLSYTRSHSGRRPENSFSFLQTDKCDFKMFKLNFLLFNFLLFCGVRSEVNITCTQDFCTLQRETGECVDQVAEGCRENGRMFKSPTPCNCCEFCVAYLDENAACVSSSQSQTPLNRICGPGLTCVTDASTGQSTCKKMTSIQTQQECIKKQKEYDDKAHGSYGEISWRPICDSEGDFGPVHCIPNSICYCIDPENGERIFGEALYASSDAEGLSCSCSRAAWRANSYLGLDTDFFRCLPEGDYDQLQCLDDECMCVDSLTGMPTGSARVHVTGLKEGALPCFNKTLYPESQFEKSCELERKNILMEKEYLEIKGVELLFVELPNCTEDGNYHRVQIRKKGKGFKCVDPEGNLIEEYEMNNGTSDCKCARTKWLMRKGGIPELPECDEYGRFRAWQCWRDKCYCVDCDGKQISLHKSYSNVNNLPCFENYSCADNKNGTYPEDY